MASARQAIRATGDFVVRLLRDVIYVPVRTGTLDLRAHPGAIAGITWAVTAIFVAVLLAILLARPLRAVSPLDVFVSEDGGSTVVPSFLVPAVLVLLAVSFALALAGSQRCRLWLRLLMLVVVVGVLTGFVAVGLEPGAVSATSVGALVAVVLTAAWSLAIWTGRTHAALDVFVLLVLCGATLLLAYAAQAGRLGGGGTSLTLVTTSLLLSYVGILATPIAFISGLGATALGIDVVGSAGSDLGRRAPLVLSAIVAAGVIAWQVVVAVPDRLSQASVDGAWAIGRGLVVALVVVGLSAAAWGLCHRGASRESDEAHDLPQVSAVALRVGEPVAYGLTATVVATGLAGVVLFIAAGGWPLGIEDALAGVRDGLSRVVGWLGRLDVVTGVRLAVVAVMVIFAVVAARRGRALVASIASIDAVVIAAYFGLPYLTPDWALATDALGDIGVAAAAVLLAWWGIRRQIDRARMSLVLVLALLSALVRQADFFSLPFGFVIGASTLALLLIGLVWSFLTDGGAAHQDAPHYPRDAQLLLVLARALFGISIVAWAVLGKEVGISSSLGEATSQAVLTLGTALVITGVLAAARAVSRPSSAPGPS